MLSLTASGVVKGRKFAARQCSRDESSVSGSSCLSASAFGSECCPYLRHQGGMVSHVLCRIAFEIVLWTERHSVALWARYIPGRNNNLADQFSRPDQVLPTE